MSSSKPIRREKLPWREIDGRTVIVHPAAGTVHELNATGTMLWKNSDGQNSIHQLAEMLKQNFDIQPNEAAEDVLSFFNELDEKGLIGWTEGSI
jgi:hypothetical protein